jgi:hypothetical protein
MPRYITIQTANGYMIAAYHEAGGDTGVPTFTALGSETYSDGIAAEKEVLRMLAGRPNIQGQ